MCGEGPLTFLSEKPRRAPSRWIYCSIHLPTWRQRGGPCVLLVGRRRIVPCGQIVRRCVLQCLGHVVAAFCVNYGGPKEVRGGPINRSIEKRGELGLFFFAPETGRNANDRLRIVLHPTPPPSCALRLIIINLITSSLMETINTTQT
jgi:hypothetical protein